MPQGSIYYALGRLSVIRKNALDQQKLERLLQAQTAEEARKTLAEIGWAESDDYDKMAAEHVRRACALARELTTDEKLLDCFLYRYDVNNLKMLIKARSLEIGAGDMSPCGTYPVDTLSHAVAEHKYDKLHPVLKDALDALEKRLAVKIDPLDIDVTLDKALYRLIFQTLPKGSDSAKRYFRARVDILNLVMALRALHMGRNAAFLKALLIEGGTVPTNQWLKAYEKPEKLPLLVNSYGTKIYHAAIAAQMDAGKLSQLEKLMDDYLLSVYTAYKRDMDKVERIIGYLLLREREAAAVRLIMAGKVNGFANDVIRERLRELYG